MADPTPVSQPYPVVNDTKGNILTQAGDKARGALGAAKQGVTNLIGNIKNGYTGPGGPLSGQTPQNIVQDYRWTLSNIQSFMHEIPFIELKEYKCNESAIQKQLDLYTRIVGDTVDNVASLFKKAADEKYADVESVYANIWPKNNFTGAIYTFPYFNPSAFSLQTSDWQALDSLGDSLGQLAGAISPALGELVSAGIKAVDAVTDLAMKAKYPSVGVVDRPKLFANHTNRQINISFPLYNTVDQRDWKKHRDLIYKLMYQNLFYKRDYVTGIPPVFYEVRVPGQYYCYAAAMTDIKVENLGNVRLLNNSETKTGTTSTRNGDVVPDAYQVNLTLTELVMPSQNQFKMIMNKDGTGSTRPRISVATVKR